MARSNHDEFVFTNPWCPLTGSLLTVDYSPDSPVFQSWEVIWQARFHIETEYSCNLLLPDLAIPEVFTSLHMPCDRCKHRADCDRSDCAQYDVYGEQLLERRRIYLRPNLEYLPEVDHMLVLCARAVFDNFEYLEEQILQWPSVCDTAAIYGSHYGHTLASVWEHTLKETRGFLVDEDLFDDELNIPDSIILAILAICKAWLVLEDVLHLEISEDRPFILQDAFTARSLLWKARELHTDKMIKSLWPDVVRGRKVLEGAKKGQKGRLATKEIQWKELQEEADKLFHKFPHLSKTRVAEIISKKLRVRALENPSEYRLVTPGYIRKKIKHPSDE